MEDNYQHLRIGKGNLVGRGKQQHQKPKQTKPISNLHTEIREDNKTTKQELDAIKKEHTKTHKNYWGQKIRQQRSQVNRKF